MQKILTDIITTNTTDKEEWLKLNYTEIVPNITSCISEKQYGLDLGSTYVRHRQFWDKTETFGESFELNSDVIEVDDISGIRSKNRTIYANLEVFLQDTTPAKENKIIPQQVHFVKGELATTLTGSAKLERHSKISKVDMPVTYMNLLTQIALANLTGAEPSKVVNAQLAIALPPEDFLCKGNVEKFKQNLAGTYQVNFPRINYSVEINIDCGDIYVEKEPDAVAYTLAYYDSTVLDSTIIIIDGGGKTTNIAIVVNGRIQDKYSSTGKYGGLKLCKEIAKKLVTDGVCKTAPPVESVESALATAKLIRGGVETDIAPQIESLKSEFAETLFNDIMNVLEEADLELEDVTKFVYHGGSFRNTKTSTGSISTRDKLNDKLMSIAEIEFSQYEGSDMVDLGVILSRWASLIV